VCGQNVVSVNVRHMVHIITTRIFLRAKYKEIKFGVRTALTMVWRWIMMYAMLVYKEVREKGVVT
jgi:hypothetical protein